MSHEGMRSHQLTVIHLSDIHFGNHQFDPPPPPSGPPPSGRGPTLAESLSSDWNTTLRQTPPNLILAVTGDITNTANGAEFEDALNFLHFLPSRAPADRAIGPENVFMVPGNHDLEWASPTPRSRWQAYTTFYEEYYHRAPGRAAQASDPGGLTRVHDRSADLGIIVAEFNSAAHIHKGHPSSDRGEIDGNDLERARQQLEAIASSDRDRSIKIALLHHHPVLIPAFGEPGHDYDAVLYGKDLLQVLREYRFHLILHGHKHYPHTFSYDTATSWTSEDVPPLMIVAGGSAGVRDEALPHERNATNTYNVITLSLNLESQITRVRVETRGLLRDNPAGQRLPPQRWTWGTLRVVDQLLIPRRPPVEAPYDAVDFDGGENGAWERTRTEIYAHLRGNLPVVELIPSLRPAYEYEARVRIAAHQRRHPQDIPVEVTWTAGPKFNQMARCLHRDNPEFLAAFGYFQPMLIQARIRFADGQVVLGHVYTYLPGT